MLKDDMAWPKHRQYVSLSDYEVSEFFSEGLRNSCTFDLNLGFFSSSAIRLLADSFATFIHRGGRMRMIINQILSPEDRNAIADGQRPFVKDVFDINDLYSLRRVLSKRDKQFFECLSWMIANKRIEIRIISPKGSNGISHSKSGFFYDGINGVYFSGSCNFSKTALVDNIETIDVACSWDLGPSVYKIENAKKNFELVFGGGDTTVEYLDVESVVTNIQEAFHKKDLVTLLQQEKEIIEEMVYQEQNDTINPRVQKILDKARREADVMIADEWEKSLSPHFPYASGPREYQIDAYNRWRQLQKGLFAMATGTGKTITALNCLLEIYNHFGYYKAVILVPTITLVEQWEEECRKFNFIHIVKVCSNYPDWKSSVENYILRESISVDNKVSYIVISTYASFFNKNIFYELNKLSANRTLLIADEAHNMGTDTALEKLDNVKFKRRIGLSATPDRKYDEKSTSRIMSFFGCESGYTYEYTMKQAIDNGALCRYLYYPHIVRLTDGEMADYKKISVQIVKCMGRKDADGQELLVKLLLKRKQIIHKASNKKLIFKEILRQLLVERGNLNYTLVYVPEGNQLDDDSADTFDKKDVIMDDEVSCHLIDEYTAIVRDLDPHIVVRQFTANSENRENILQEYSEGKINVLTSMKCLDEGVDVPRSEVAIFCSSTGNPRQFIQRRGRVLRTHPDKHYAHIHDLIVVPDFCVDKQCYSLERSLVKTELERVRNFALLSDNWSDSSNVLEDILDYYKLSIFN